MSKTLENRPKIHNKLYSNETVNNMTNTVKAPDL